ncbi:type I-B CRISPR-associated protein Cas7/Cst2/DevR [Tissierella creatinophila]|uniref:CRISPR-associated negative autoregulator DevR/Csa2 n=1 Tax=Tissierella creatinophila DSM 6911 TaxID=1123403 RepID=A0A1U7M8M2_TISCR|nr:type I-B CRISPR-associated protein Cas7/Cst2/DevR [Tissierella creatinophila]OLS03600.1 CRISPR-associated negative autoregulator DevR/Csa2 [Tissierella creatinophila DSM 6911]
MTNKGLTVTIIFEAESANYGESIGNVSALKKISRGKGEQYTYISRQAIRYNIVNQMGIDNTKIGLDGSVLQFAPDTTIKEYAEIDLFGYMKTAKPSKTRSAIVRLSNAISLEPYRGDLDFLTNKGLLDRYNKQENELKDGGNIAQSEIHRSLYSYTITIDLDKVGIDENDEIEIENTEKANRINKFLNTVRYLYRDIKGRREDLKPLFIIGGVYDIKNPIFQNAIEVKNNNLIVDKIIDVLSEELEKETMSGIVKGLFENENEIIDRLEATNMREFFENIKFKVNDYYESN